LEIRILGPLEVLVGGKPVQPSAAKPRIVLAHLAVNAGEVVTSGALIEELWGDKEIASHATTLRTYIFKLRRLLDPPHPDGRQAPQALRSVPGGYLLDRSRLTLDSEEYRRLVADGYRELRRDDLRAAREHFTQAIKLWRGTPLADVRTGPRLDAAVRYLEELRMNALDHWIEIELRSGRHREVLADLTGLAAENPLNERLQSQLMVALYRSDRRNEALQTFQRVRRKMLDALGLDPSPLLQRIHHGILTGDPRLFDNAHPADASSVTPQIPWQDLWRQATRRPGAA
jgi:DNA-binding SARP family transcriptional activator